MQLTETGAVLEDLIETLEDGRKGYESAAESLANEHGQLAGQMRTLSEQRARFSTELRELASEHGITIEEEGSIGGALHRGWINLKDALTGDSAEAVLKAVESGEHHAVEEYSEALDKDLPEPVQSVVARQASDINKAYETIKASTID